MKGLVWLSKGSRHGDESDKGDGPGEQEEEQGSFTKNRKFWVEISVEVGEWVVGGEVQTQGVGGTREVPWEVGDPVSTVLSPSRPRPTTEETQERESRLESCLVCEFFVNFLSS